MPTSTRQDNCLGLPISPWPVYIVVMLYFATLSMNLMALGVVIYNKLCYEAYHNLTLCTDPTFTKTHVELQQEGADWSNYLSLVQLAPALLSNLLLSSYCDKVGHKLTLVLPSIGSALANLWIAMIVTPKFASWPIETLIVYAFLNTFLGYYPMILMASFSYVSIAVPTERRHIYLAIAEGTINIGMVFGTLVSGPIIDNIGLDYLAYITAGISVFGVIFVLVFVTEIPKYQADTYKWSELLKPKHLLDCFKCIYKKRQNYDRLSIQLCFAIYSITFVAVSTISINYLYLVKEVGFSMTQYSTYNSVSLVLKAATAPAVLMLGTYCKWDKMNIVMGSLAALMIGFSLLSFGISLYYIIIGTVFLSVQACVFALMRDLQARIMSADEYGKLFAFDALLQCILSTVTTVVFDLIYSASVSFWPQLSYAVCSFIIVCALYVGWALDYFQRKVE